MCPLYFFLVLTPSFIWPVKEEVEARATTEVVCPPAAVSGRPSLKRVINAVSYSSSSA